MSAKLWEVASANAFSTTLNGSLASGDTEIVLTSVTGLTYPGVLVIDRQDANNVDTPTAREFITYTGISSNTLTGCTRGVAGSTAQSHNSGARVEETMSVTHWGDMVDFMQISHDAQGRIMASMATISSLNITESINFSTATMIGTIPTYVYPVWVFAGTASTPTVGSKPLPMPKNGQFQFFSVTSDVACSGASVLFDVNKNMSSIFDSACRMAIVGGGTYVSTASISTKVFNSGDIFTIDIDYIGDTAPTFTVLAGGQ